MPERRLKPAGLAVGDTLAEHRLSDERKLNPSFGREGMVYHVVRLLDSFRTQ